MNNDSVNPFQSPVSSGTQTSTGNEHSNEETRLLLQQTRPWTLTIGILMIIGAAFMVLAGIGIMIMGSIGGATGMPAGMAIGMGCFYLVLSAFYVIPAMLLLKYSSRISDYVASPDTARLNSALGTQKSFWKFCGIGALVMIGLYILLIVGYGVRWHCNELMNLQPPSWPVPQLVEQPITSRVP